MSNLRFYCCFDLNNYKEIKNNEINKLKVFFPKINRYYRPICLYNGYNYPKCFNNENSLCKTKYIDFPKNLLHEFDGKNCIKCLCG